MTAIRMARSDEAGAVCAIDPRALDSPGRRAFIERAVAAGELYVAIEGDVIAGYVVFDRSFFEQPFVSLLFVVESRRRQGIAAAMMRHVESLCPAGKLFTSTNESNTQMQRLCDKLGFARSGRIENLDEDDPEIVYFKRTGAERTR